MNYSLRLYVLVITIALSYGSLFVEKPQNVTLFLNESGTFNFTCVTEASITTSLFVYTNGSQTHEVVGGDIVYYHATKTGELVFVNGVKIATKVAYNGSVIHCETHTGGSEGDGERAEGMMLLQGLLAAVTDFRVAVRASEVVVSWLPPFTLDVTGVEYDITYSLLVFNVTDENQPLSVPCDLCHNLTLTHIVFHPPDPLSGQSFNFTVTPQNGAGSGPSTGPLTATLTHSIPSSSAASSISSSPGVPDTGPSNRDTGSSSVAGIVSGTLAVLLAVCVLLALLLIIFLYCGHVRQRTRQPREPVASYNPLCDAGSPDQFQTTEGLEEKSVMSPGGASITSASEQDVTTDVVSTPREVRKRHKQSSHSPEEPQKCV